MIPSTTNRLLVTEDWKKIYQSYRNADFKSYDFDTLRRTMITYLRENYPEDFNDFIDSSEYVALIDLIAYLGQNISFRVDLNARENFLETAQRRDSVLRLARLINYNAKRNTPATGLLKIVSVQTTDNVFDSNGVNLSNAIINWNDATNSNWFEQIVAVVNSAMTSGLSYGKPASRAIVDGIPTEKYNINSTNNGVPVYTFSKSISGSQMTFEIVSSDFDNTIYEATPTPGSPFAMLYRNDGRGNSSSNTGFFVQFKQGSLTASNFAIDNPVPNEIIGINAPNINETDVWLWQLNSDGTYPSTPWTKVSGLSGNNVIYNSLSENNRNLYAILTRENDQIDLNFADGSFGDLPKGQFRLYYRQSNGMSYSVKPEQMRNVSFSVEYVNASGQAQVLKFYTSLQYTVSNSATAETNADIKIKAPQAFYSQNRMVTAEDYNIVPLTAGTDILKVKTINRVSSGVSKYFEMSDVTGKYSNINVYANDGILYQQDKEYTFEYGISNRNEIKFNVNKNINKIFNLREFRSFYLDKYTRPSLLEARPQWSNITNYYTGDIVNYNNFLYTSLKDNNINHPPISSSTFWSASLPTNPIAWNRSTKTTNQSTGYFTINSLPVPAGEFSSNNLKYGTVGALIKFVSPKKVINNVLQQTYFLPNGTLTPIQDSNTSSVKWAKVVSIVGDGYNGGKGSLATGVGPVVLSTDIPSGAIPVEIISKFSSSLDSAIENTVINLSVSRKNFGLSLDAETSTWFIISDTNIDLLSPFSLANQADATDTNRDSSWMIAFVWSGNKYVARYRVTEYIFESEKETAFFVEPKNINYDYLNDTVIKDKIVVLGINPSPTDTSGLYLKQDHDWQIDSAVIEPDGYQEPKKVKISFFDKDSNGQIDNPDSFKEIVDPAYISQSGYKDKFVFFKLLLDGQRYIHADSNLFLCFSSELDVPTLNRIDGQLYYFYNELENIIKYWDLASSTFIINPSYFARAGRSNIKFQYVHKAGEDRRVDPSKTNLMDVYLLTRNYDTDFRNWVSSGTGTEPLAPTSQGLSLAYASSLEAVKSISDELIFHPTRYKVLFGDKSSPTLQATFKATKNPSRATSDNDLKTRILTAIDNFFSVDNWEFGQSFHFSELATYVMNVMTPDITNFIIVPKQNNSFGSLYEISCQSNEIFVSGATIDNVEIIDSITTSELKATGNVVNIIGGQS